MEAGRERVDLGGAYGCYVTNRGYAVYSPHGWRIGYRAAPHGARRLAQRAALRCGQARP